MGFLKNLRKAFKDFLSGGNSASVQRSPAARVNYGNRDSRNQTVSSSFNRRSFLDSLKGGGSEQKEENRVRNAFKASDYSSKYKSLTDNSESSLVKLDKALKKDVPDPKQAAAQKAKKQAEERSKKAIALDPKTAAAKQSKERFDARVKSHNEEMAEFHRRTGNKYNAHTGDKEHDKRAAQLIKGGFNSSDIEAEKMAVEYHPIAYSAARGAASGATFGASDLMLSKRKGERGEAEKYYQENKNKVAEGVGEILGSLASFGVTAGATEKAGAKLVGKVAPNAAERLAQTELIQNAAKRGVSKAVKKGLVGEASEELIKQVGKDKAKKIVAAVGTDIVQNATTGLLYDFNRASTEHEIGSDDWWKEMGKSAAFNAAITGGIAGGSVLKGNKRAAVEAADELGRLGKAGFVKQAPDAKVSLKRRRKTDVVLPNRRPIDAQVDAALDDMIEQASTVEDFMALGLSRGDAELLARPIRVTDAASEEVRYNPFLDGMDSAKGVSTRKGNIKNLKEKLKTDELLPRNRNTQYVSTPRSVERVDTSVEGLSKRLDELRAQNPQTDKEKRALETKIHDVEDRLNRAEWRKEGGANMDAMRKAYAGEYAGFDMSKSTNSHQSDVLEGKVKGKTATIVEMSPDEYMERAYRQIFKKPSAKGARFAEMPENNKDIEKYAEAMRNGEKFPLPYLDFTNAGQEGRHRALAAKMAGIDKIPVVIIDDATNPKALIEDAAENLNPKEAQTIAEQYNLDDVIPFTNDTPTVPKRGINANRADDFAMVSDDIPTDDLKGLRANDTRAELEDRVEELGKQTPNPNAEESLKVNKIAPDEPIAKDLPSGVKQVRSAYEYNNGEKIEGGTLTKWKEAWNASKEYSKSHATGEKVRQSKVAVTQLNAMDSEAERALREQLVASGDLNYEAISTPELYDKVAKQLRDDADHYIKEMIEINEGGALDFRSTPEWQARVQYILGTVDPSADEASEIAYTEAFKLAQNISSKGGQVLNLRRNFVHLTPLGKRDAILDDFISILDKSKGFRKNHPALNSLGKFDQRNYIRAFLMEDEGIMNGVQKVVEADSLDDVSEAFTELMIKVNEKNPHSAFDVIQELRYLNMLGNPKTHFRNVFGSAFFSPMRQISNAIRAGIEDPIAKAASKEAGVKMEVAKHGGISLEALKEANVSNPTTEAGKAAKEAFERMRNEILGSAKYETTMQKGRGRTLAGKVLDAVSDFNSNLLAKEDDFFKSRAFKENYIKSYNRYLKDGTPITPKVKKQIEQEALQEAQIATFNEYNEFAKWLSNITRKANDENASALGRWGARGVNAVMPFTKVPANLMKQSINYSPIGIAKGMLRIKQAAKKGDAQLLNRAIDDLASGLTGTGVFGLGMLLGKTTDMFTTNAGKNDPAAKFKKDRGMQNYSITFKDPETGQGHSFTLDWLVPMSATFFSGIEMANQLKAGDFDIMDIGNDWSTVMTRLAEPVMETSMLSGLHGMLETMRGGSDSDDNKSAIQVLLRETAQSYVSSMIPTILGQAARTAYKSDMQITGDDDWQYFWNQTKSKAGLANTNILGEPLGADTDAYGNIKGQKESGADYVKSALKNFLSPANIQKVDFSEVDNEKLRAYEEAVKNGADPEEMAYLFPKKQYKKQFKLAGESVPMTNRELSTYNQAKTTGGEEGMRFVLENIMFNRYDYDEKGNKVPTAEAYTKEQKEALMQQFAGKSMREVEQWLYQQPEFQNASDAERKKAIEGLWKLTKDSNAVASQRVGERAVYEAQGKDGYEYDFKNEVSEKKRDALQPAVDSGLLTYQDIVDFERNGGKVSYSDEDGGSATTYYSKKSMIEYFIANGIPYEKAEALYNAYKNKNAKPYSGNDLSSGYGRRRRGYRRYGRSGGKGKTAKTPEIKQSNFKASKQTYKSIAESLTPRTKSSSTANYKTASVKGNAASTKSLPKVKSSASAKVTPPTVKFKKYEV